MSRDDIVRFRSQPRRQNPGNGPPILRLSHPYAFAALLKQAGAPWQQHFRNGKLPIHAEDPDAFVTIRGAWALFDSAARAESDGFGWRVGHKIGDRNLSASLVQQIEHAPTLYVGLQEFVRLIQTEASDLEIGIEEREHDVLFYTHYPTMKNLRGYRQSQAYQLPVYLAFIRHYLGDDWCPTEIGIEAHRVPQAAENAFPGARIRTGQERGYIRIPRSVLSTPPPDVIDLDGLNKMLLGDLSFANRLRALVQPYLADGIPSKTFAAELMETSPRTLTRRLAESRITYRGLLDELHFNAAKDMLANSDLSIREIARRTGYDDPAHFARMFRRVGGHSPSAYRKSSQQR